MKLSEALQTINAARESTAPIFRVKLCCGSTPLHLGTFLHGQVQARLSDRKVELATGLYGDLIGNVERSADQNNDSMAVVIEWQDLEPRLGFRQLGGWKPSQTTAIVDGFEKRLSDLENALGTILPRLQMVISLPGLSLPPAFLPINAKSSASALRLQAAMAEFAARMAAQGATLVNSETLDRNSPPVARRDLKAELLTGFPYSIPHADKLAELLAECLVSYRVAKKGLITDLDDTLWSGLAGEVGPGGVSWSLDRHTHLHGIYQQFLAALAEQGVLLGIATKNDFNVVERIFQERPDLLVSSGQFFPQEVHWRPKSESVARILESWNIGADSVVFIDDSPIEIGEVQAAHPSIECILFPKNDPAKALQVFYHLRDLFGKDRIQNEDAVRLDSLRQRAKYSEANSSAVRQETFLSTLEASITWIVAPPPAETRILELVNKTNQFNMNGRRFSETEWQRLRSQTDAAVVAVSYKDKFGSLGTIAVMAGAKAGTEFRLNTWVMSCRAFSRRIEYQSMRFLFDHFGVEQIVCDFCPTEKNGPFRDFAALILSVSPEGPFTLCHQQFNRRCPPLYQDTQFQPSEVLS
jgi:FkbH-like protein